MAVASITPEVSFSLYLLPALPLATRRVIMYAPTTIISVAVITAFNFLPPVMLSWLLRRVWERRSSARLVSLLGGDMRSQAEPRLPGTVLRGALKQPGSSQWLPNKVREIARHISETPGWMSSDPDLFPQGCADQGRSSYELQKQMMTGTRVNHCGRGGCCWKPRCSAPNINLCWDSN